MLSVIIAIVVFLVLSAFFSGSEIAFITANKLGVEVERGKGTRRGRLIAGFYDKPKEFLSTMLVGNNIALVAFTALVSGLIEPLLKQQISSVFWIAFIITIITTIIVLLFGEFLPKTFFRLYSNEALNILAYPLGFFKWFLKLPSWVMIKISNVVIRLVFRSSSETAEDAITRLDLQDFVEGTISEDEDDLEADMFKNALQLKDLKVRECMVPRTELEHMDIADEMSHLKEIFKETRHSRIIISEGDIDHILGYVHHQQLLDNPRLLRRIIMDIPFVPETMNALDLMFRFIKERTNIACVVDEFGGTAGLITLEDLLEEIFGEIEDEYDQEDFIEEQISEYEFLFSGRLEVDFLNEKYENLNFPEGEYETLSGYIVMTSGTIPESGDVLELDDYRFVFEQVSEKKIETVRVFIMDLHS